MIEALEPELPICDPHHHLMDNAIARYLLEDLTADVRSGHNIVQTMYMECGSWYWKSGPEILRPVGEIEFVIAQEAPVGLLAGIVGYADLRLGGNIQEVLDAQQAVAGTRLSGIRFCSAWDPDPAFCTSPNSPTAGILRNRTVQRGAAAIGRLGLPMDCWMYSHQLLDMIALAQKLPNQVFVLNHLGTPLLGSGRQPSAHGVHQKWREDLAEVARCENVLIKLGGIGMEILGAPWAPRLTPTGWDMTTVSETPPNASVVSEHWKADITFCIDTFGPHRCMFESNFPIDRQTFDYVTLWNAFKLMTLGYSAVERNALFYGTAVQTYRLPPTI